MSHHGVPPSENLARVAALADKAAGYPSEAVRLGDGRPSGVFTLRLAEPVETDEGAFYPVPAELEAVMQRGAQRLTGEERAELHQAINAARMVPPRANPQAAVRGDRSAKS